MPLTCENCEYWPQKDHFQESGWNIRGLALFLFSAYQQLNFNKLFGYRCGDMKVLPILLEFLTFLSRKWLPLNVPYLPKHRQSQACYKGIVNNKWFQTHCTLMARNPDCACRSCNSPHCVSHFFRYAYFVLCKEWAPIVALTYWVLSFLPDVFECFILKGEKSLRANEKAFGITESNWGILDSPFHKITLFEVKKKIISWNWR